MTKDQVENVLSACETAEIKKYMFVNDTPTIMRNDENGVIKLLGELLVNIRRPIVSENGYDDNGVEFLGCDLPDVHEVRVIASYDKLKKFTDTLGVSFTDDELKLILEMDKSGVNLEPVTGNYIQFKFKTQEQYEAMTDKEKEVYDELKKFEMKPLINFYYLPQSVYDELKDTDKTTYDELKAKYEKAKEEYLAPNQAAQISY